MTSRPKEKADSGLFRVSNYNSIGARKHNTYNEMGDKLKTCSGCAYTYEFYSMSNNGDGR